MNKVRKECVSGVQITMQCQAIAAVHPGFSTAITVEEQLTKFAKEVGLIPIAILLMLFTCLPSLAESDSGVNAAGIPKYPDVSATQITFLYGGNLWIVARQGGTAKLIPTNAFPKTNPKFSPDGRTIAFTGAYDGVYTVPSSGGPVVRLTHRPGATDLCDWTPDGKLLFMSNATFAPADFGDQAYLRQLFVVSSTGGLPEQLPLGHAANGAISPNGEWLAYTPYAEGRTEHREGYKGGLAPDIWLYGLRNHQSKKITTWQGTDTGPMWNGNTLYYLSDAGPEGRRNIWSHSLHDGLRQQITRFADFDVKWPSVGPGPSGTGEIVFVTGDKLFLLDLKTKHPEEVHVSIPSGQKDLTSKRIDVAGLSSGWNWSSSPDGSRIVLEARGRLWVLSQKGSSGEQLPQQQGTARRFPAWSPDGNSIAFFSDASGEYELYICASDGTGSPHQLTHLGAGFRFQPVWSPDSQMIAFTGQSGEVYIVSIRNGNSRLITRDPIVRRPQLAWSPDSRWLAYQGSLRGLRNLWVYDTQTKSTQAITSGGYDEAWPVFDPTGAYLFFVTNRNFGESLIEDSVDYSNVAYASAQLLMAIPLRSDIPEPWKPAPSSTTAKGTLDFAGAERRAVVVTSDVGSYSDLGFASDGKLVYGFTPEDRLFPKSRGGSQLRAIDFESWNSKAAGGPQTVFDGLDPGVIRLANKEVLFRKGGDYLALAPDGKQTQKFEIGSLMADVDPSSERQQIFNDAWRLYRDFFYDPNLRGVDWQAVRAKYQKLLSTCADRGDLDYVVGEMIGELGSSHVYLNAPPGNQPTGENIGLIGADFAEDRGHFRLARIYDGSADDFEARGVLRRPGVAIAQGDYLLAVDGKPVDTSHDPWLAFEGTIGRNVRLTLGHGTDASSGTYEQTVVPEPYEGERHRGWVEANRTYVEQKSKGRIGYMYVKMTSEYGFREFTRQFAKKLSHDALIIDIRWNQGGQIPYHWLDILRRQIAFYTSDMRQDPHRSNPGYMVHGPICVLINGVTQSGGDVFAELIKKSHAATLVGSRTKGDMAGAGGVYIPFVDGGSESLPTVGFYDATGRSIVEGEGVIPDINVEDEPYATLEGPNPQLDRAIALLLQHINRAPRDVSSGPH